ncbi:hypothetical protein CRG98_049460, partial [Punica granatum]
HKQMNEQTNGFEHGEEQSNPRGTHAGVRGRTCACWRAGQRAGVRTPPEKDNLHSFCSENKANGF